MSDDLIKRSDALSAAGDMSYIAYEIRRKIRMIPSAEPMPEYIDNILIARHYCNGMVAMNEQCYNRLQARDEPKRGHWIYHPDDLFPADSTQECSVCHEEEFMSICNENFCPNCGARMVKPDE